MKEYAELIYHMEDKQWKLYMNESTGILDIEANGLEFRKALNEASKHGWNLVDILEDFTGHKNFVVVRQLPETPFSEGLLDFHMKELRDKYKDLEKRFENLAESYKITKDTIQERDNKIENYTKLLTERDNIIKSLLLEGRDSISITGEFEETVKFADLNTYDLYYNYKELSGELKTVVWIEEIDDEEGEE
jgi:predicted nuclease with TOPRIM domain